MTGAQGSGLLVFTVFISGCRALIAQFLAWDLIRSGAGRTGFSREVFLYSSLPTPNPQFPFYSWRNNDDQYSSYPRSRFISAWIDSFAAGFWREGRGAVPRPVRPSAMRCKHSYPEMDHVEREPRRVR